MIIIKNKEVNEAYNMLLGHFWLISVKINDNWSNNLITILGNKIIKIISVSLKKGPKSKERVSFLTQKRLR